MRDWRIAASMLIASIAAGCGDATADYPDNGLKENGRFALPSSLVEISGLAAASEHSVYAHDDEHAIVHELRVTDGKSLRVFALGEPSVEGDFEGVATADGSVYLVTSDGLIYAAKIGDHRTRVAYRVHDIGIGVRCEVEGLSRAPTPGHLLVLCKRLHHEKRRGLLEIYRWKVGNERTRAELWLSVSLRNMLNQHESAEFAPSALEWDEERKHLYVVSARSRHMLMFDENGQLLEKQRLDGTLHPQTEGLTILPGRRLILADEGSRTRKPYLSIYREPQIFIP